MLKVKKPIEKQVYTKKELEAIYELWRMGELSWKLKGKQQEIYAHFTELEDDVGACLISRRFGKCVAEGTLVPTKTGLKKIEQIKVGDYVYGYNSDGKVELTKVKQVHYQGEKEVVDLICNKKVLATVTEDHRFLTYNTRTNRQEVKSVKELRSHIKIRKEVLNIDCGEVHEPHAYAIGALLGDGCSRQGVNTIHISSSDSSVVSKVSSILNCSYFKQSEHSFTWILHNEKVSVQKYRPLKCNYYEEWIKDRYAHEKFIDIEVLKTWDRESCLQLLAGLIDTDGSVSKSKKDNCVVLMFSSQSMSLIKAYQFLMQQLFQYPCSLVTDNRSKYVNGPCYSLHVKNNRWFKRILKELDPYLVVNSKKWKEEYSSLRANNTAENYVGVKVENKRKAQCWDIGIDNGTHLYIMQNGLITHNSFVMQLIATELCIREPGTVVKYACPKQNMVNKILIPNMRTMFEDAPPEITYEYSSADKVIRFWNGSEIQFAGTDNGNAENLRGGFASLCILDEAAFMDDLRYIVESILLPTTDTTDGKLFLASTPNPKDPEHQFHTEFVYPLEAQGKLIKFTLHDSPMLTPAKIEKIIKRYVGGINNPAFRAEYMVEIPKSSELTVIPEFNDEVHVIQEYKIPTYRDFYVSMDVGFRDLTCVLFCYYNFMEASLYIMDEIVINGPEMTTDYLATLIKTKEDRVFNEFPPFLRVMDNDLKLANDLSRLHQIYFMPTAKDNKETAVNNVRMWFAQGKIKIHERCKHLIYHTRRAQWDTVGGKIRNEFRHLSDAPDGSVRGGHADALDALIYLVRNINSGHNPYPDKYGEKRGPSIFQSTKYEENNSIWSNLIPKSLRKGR